MPWRWIWIGWLIFMAIFDFIANFTKGATFSEYARIWFRSTFAKVILALFLIAFYLHIVLNWSVWPIVVLGSLIGWFIARKGKMFRWDKWFEGLLVSSLMVIMAGLGPILADGTITKAEWWMILTMFIGGIAAWCKTHPPQLDQ